MIESIQAELSRGDSAAAIAAAQGHLSEHPDDARALHLLGVAQRIGGDLTGAGESLDRAIALMPDEPQFHLSRALLALSQGQPQAAAAALDAVTAQDPNALAAYVLGVQAALERGDLDAARAQLRLAQRVAAEHPHVLAMEGNLALVEGRASAALGPLTRALEAVPEDGFVLSSLGLAFLAAGNPAFAAQSLRRALDSLPRAVHLRHALIEALRRQGHLDEALAEVATLRAACPGDESLLALAGDLHLARGELEPALAVWGEMLTSSPRPAGPLALVLRTLVQAGATSAAEMLRDDVVAAQPDQDAVWQAGALVAGGDARALHAYAQRWLARLPDSFAGMAARAASAEALGELGAAEADADLVLGLHPAHPEAHLVKLRAELRRDPSAALARAERLVAAARTPETRAACLGWRALALDALGRCAEAAADWQLARAEDPSARPLPPADRPAPAVQPSDGGAPPRLLAGPPGSVAYRIALLLQGLEGLAVLDDRHGFSPRQDGLDPDRADGAVATQQGWRLLIERGGVDTGRALDWLLHFDARHEAHLPDARLLAVLGDPRDLLLEWLAMGSPQQYAFPGVEAAGRWLQDALKPLLRRLQPAREGDLLLRREELESDPVSACTRIAAFCDLSDPPDADALRRVALGLGGLPRNLPAGRWRAYAEALAEGFAPLHEVATQLGYPAA